MLLPRVLDLSVVVVGGASERLSVVTGDTVRVDLGVLVPSNNSKKDMKCHTLLPAVIFSTYIMIVLVLMLVNVHRKYE